MTEISTLFLCNRDIGSFVYGRILDKFIYSKIMGSFIYSREIECCEYSSIEILKFLPIGKIYLPKVPDEREICSNLYITEISKVWHIAKLGIPKVSNITRVSCIVDT